MPLNASIGYYLPFDTLLATRLPAAHKPLRIPKVFKETGKSRFNRPQETAVFRLFIAVVLALCRWAP